MSGDIEITAQDPAKTPISSQVSLPVRIGFGVGDFGFLLVWQGTALFLMYFYTDVLGISAAMAGLIYLIAMVWDAVSDPIIATLADRTQTKMGKYRPWLLFGALPFAISYPLAFSGPPAWLAIDVIVWALITHIVLRTAYTVVSMPFNSLQARLTSDAQERSVLAGFRMVGAASGGLAVVFITPVLVGTYGEGRQAEAYFAAACIAGATAFFALIYCFFAMKEPDDAPAETARPIWEDLKSIGPILLNNPPLIRVFAIIVIASICMGMFGKNMLYHFKYHLNAPEMAVFGLVMPAVFLILAVPFWVWLAGKTSKRTALASGTVIALVGYAGFFLNPTTDLTITLIMIALTGIGGAALAVMFWAMLPDTVEYGEAMTGVRAEAKTFGFATFAQKAAVGINAILLGLLLSWVGFEANVDQSEGTLLGMKAVMALVPAIGAVAILWILKGYKLDRERHAELVAKIKAQKHEYNEGATSL
jgi:GPH family glycoside/pentoside/hexuronide:cation symporter